jgi:hypothetical protein
MNALERVRKKFGNLPSAPDRTDKSPSVRSVSASPKESEKFSGIFPDLERRIRAIAVRWHYTDAEVTEVVDLTRADPEKWACAVTLDEQREAEFRADGRLPKDA